MASTTSIVVRIAVSGVRSSCAALATNRYSLGAEFPYYAVAPVGIASTNSRMYVAWGNPVAGTANPEDSFFTSVDFSAPRAVGTTAKASSGDDVPWGIIGGGIALMLGGLILVGLRQQQTETGRPLPEKEKVGSGAASD